MTDSAETTRKRAWIFVPLLYFLESIPYVIVTTMSVTMYKRLGIPNDQIALWTSLIAWPWTLKMLWGPLVDVNSTKRRWIIATQTLMIVMMALSATMLGLDNFLAASLICFVCVAMLSATHDIAADGFYLLALGQKDQAFFVGVRSTFYRLGTVFANGLLIYFAGQLEEVTPNTRFVGLERHIEHVQANPAANFLVSIWYAIAEMWARTGDAIGAFFLWAHRTAEPMVAEPIARAWFIAILFGTFVYFVAYLINQWALPRPASDRLRRPTHPGRLLAEFGQVILMIAGILLFAQQVHLLYRFLEALFRGNWQLFEDHTPLYALPKVLGAPWPFLIEQVLALFAISAAWQSTRYLFGRIGMGPAARAFFTQRRIGWILAFVLFYRFGEIMIGKMSSLFLLDPRELGGLGITTSQVGTITGVWGVLGLTLGGILGGMVIARYGIKRCLWPMVLSLNVPNLFYVWAAWALPGPTIVQWLIFVDQFGYGFGFSAYMVYLMFISQGSNYETSHYAIATGLMAFGAMISGMVSGWLQQQLAGAFPAYGAYFPFFVAVILCTIPGMVTLLFIPMDREDIKTAQIDID